MQLNNLEFDILTKKQWCVLLFLKQYIWKFMDNSNNNDVLALKWWTDQYRNMILVITNTVV